MCGPLTPKVSLRYIASHSEARVFSSAHTPVSPPGFSRRTSMVPPISTPAKRRSTVPSASACRPKKLSWRYGLPVLCESEPPAMPNLYGL